MVKGVVRVFQAALRAEFCEQGAGGHKVFFLNIGNRGLLQAIPACLGKPQVLFG